MEIERDRISHMKTIKKEHQTITYKNDKFEAMHIMKFQRQRAAIRPAPMSFWDDWRKANKLRYPKGIDRASSCTSTLYDPDKAVPQYSAEYILNLENKEVKNDVWKGFIKSPGEALIQKRFKNLVKIEHLKQNF
jgi:hypothetical protein